MGSLVFWAGNISTKNFPLKIRWKVLLKSNFVNLSTYLMHSGAFFLLLLLTKWKHEEIEFVAR